MNSRNARSSRRAAEQLDLPPAELRGQREEAAYSRGEILKPGALAGAAVLPGAAYLAERAKALAALKK